MPGTWQSHRLSLCLLVRVNIVAAMYASFITRIWSLTVCNSFEKINFMFYAVLFDLSSTHSMLFTSKQKGNSKKKIAQDFAARSDLFSQPCFLVFALF